MDYNGKECIKKAMNFHGSVDEWLDLLTESKVDTKLTNNYYFDNEGNLYLRNKKYPIKRGKYSEFASMDLVREGDGTKLTVNVGVYTFGNFLSIKNFYITFTGQHGELSDFLLGFLNNFKVKKLYLDNVGFNRFITDILLSNGYTIDDDYNLIKNNYLTEELSKLPHTSNITILNYDGLMIARSNKDTLLNLETLKKYNFVHGYEVDGEYYIIVSKI